MATHSDGNDNFYRMQHLIDEMDASNHRIDLFSKKYDGDVNKCGVTPPKKSSSMEQQFDALYDDAWRSEESDGASLQDVPIQHSPNDAGDSGCEDVVNSAIAEVSNDFLSGLRQSAAQNQYADSDESRISSDNDFKLLTGMASYARYPETATGLSDTDWNPYGTESDNNQSPRLQPHDNGSDSKCSLLTSFTPLLNSTDINSVTPNSPAKVSRLNDDRMSNIMEHTERESTINHCLVPNDTTSFSHLDSTVKPVYTPLAVPKRFGTSSDDDKQKNKNEKEVSSSRDSVSSDEEKRMIASTSSTGYSSATSGIKTLGNHASHSSKTMSIIERAKLMGIPEDILLDKKSENSNKTKEILKSRENENDSDDHLGKKVRALLSDTTHLSTYDKENGSCVDYTVLQRDLQEIQDNLDSFGVNSYGSKRMSKSPATSDNDGEIIPSTTTTPEKRKEKMVWDFGGDIGALGDHHGVGMMSEISLDTHTSNSQRPSTEKPIYNSDGDETRTSDSSTKVEDHAAADLVLAEMSEILHPSIRDLDSSTYVDQMVSNFQQKRRQLESRYQQLNNRGLAEKVYRILTNQDPESQANGILSEISADEKDMRTKLALNFPEKDFNYSSTSSWLEELNHSSQSFNPQGEVRKKLDLSGLSSVDSSWMFDRSATKGFSGFSALDDAKRLLSSQMMKASERTFNHSIEMTMPQTIQCYPLFAGSTGENGSHKEPETQQNDESQNDDTPDQRTVELGSQQDERDKCNNASHQEDHVDEGMRSNTSPTSSDQGTSVRPKDKYRPYRPPGSKEVYYTESDTASVADSVTTMESTHIGSDDAKGPNLPSHVLGSRKDVPNIAGIYSSQRNLSTVREDMELATIDEKSENLSESRSHSKRETGGSPNVVPMDTRRKEIGEHSESRRYSPSSRLRREEQSDDILERRRFNTSAREAVDRETNISPTHGVSAARRDARWAHRRDQMDREGFTEGKESQSVHDRIGINRLDVNKEKHEGRKFDEPRSRYPDFEDGRRPDDKENEPLSLRIRMTYTDENKLKENDFKYRDQDFVRGVDRKTQFLPESDRLGFVENTRFSEKGASKFDRYSPELINTLPSAHRPGPSYHHRDLYENTRPVDGHISPAFRRALSPDHQGLVRTASEENLNSSTRDARLSPAFRRALSPELRNAIESRSPLLSQHLERSLARPPSDYPRTAPPTFLARERPISPTEYVRRPINDSSNSHRFSSGLISSNRPRPRSVSPQPQSLSPRLRSVSPQPRSLSPGLRSVSPQPRAVSPVYSERNRFRSGGPNKREMEVLNENVPNQVLSNQSQQNSKTKRKVELTLEGMSSESEADLELDHKPLSKRAQLLKSALVNEGEPSINYDINAMWERFRAMNDSSNSSVNSARIEAVADLLKSPSRHLVSQYVKDREEYRIERQERAEIEREKRLREQQMQKQSSSEDEINERYAELLAIKEEERLKRRVSKKKKGKVANNVSGAEKKNDKDSLFSIPEDRSHEPSPSIANTPSKHHQKSKVARQTHVIDPNMMKLRDRISKQKTKVDKDMLKEIRRIEKLKKLESLLTSKKKGSITNETLQNQLDELSSTSAIASDFSQESGKDNLETHHAYSDDSTTAKDSSAEMHAWKAEKERRQKEFEMQKKSEKLRKVFKEKNQNKNSLSSHTPDVSEIRLLKLVKEGYLTAEEAYRLAMNRAGQDNLDSSNGSDYGHNGRRHKLYSPYSRSSNYMSDVRHVPKLKFLSSIPHSSYGVEEFEAELREKRKGHHSKYGTKSDKKERSSSLSTRHASPSVSRRGYSASPPRKQRSHSQDQHYSRKVKQSLLRKYPSENDLPRSKKDEAMRGSVAWHIPMDQPPSQWKEPSLKQQPLREVTSSVTNKPRKQKHSDTNERVSREDRLDEYIFEDKPSNIWTRPRHPQGIPKLEWEKVVSSDALASKTNHWEVDPMMDRVQYILNKQHSEHSERDIISEDHDNYEKLSSKLSLQEAFLLRKQNFISKSSERQKRMKLAKDDRQLQECLRLEREAIFAEQDRLAPPNLYAHPYSDNLYQPKHRILTKQEMKTLTARRYNKLPEVVEKKEENKKKIEARLNRLRANLFNKKVQRNILRKQSC